MKLCILSLSLLVVSCGTNLYRSGWIEAQERFLEECVQSGFVTIEGHPLRSNACAYAAFGLVEVLQADANEELLDAATTGPTHWYHLHKKYVDLADFHLAQLSHTYSLSKAVRDDLACALLQFKNELSFSYSSRPSVAEYHLETGTNGIDDAVCTTS